MTEASKTPVSSAFELVGIVAAALVLALAVQAFIVKPYRIPSGSMLPTLQINQRVLVDRLALDFSSPHVGDIIVFHPPRDYADGCADPNEGENQAGQDAPAACQMAWKQPSSETFVKRVVGLPGDRISIVNGHVIRNGKREADAYIVPCDGGEACNFPQAITVPRATTT